MLSGQLFLIVAGLLAVVAIVWLIRRGLLRESYSLVLLGAILAFVAMATWGFDAMIWLTQKLGVRYAPSGVFALGFAAVAIVALYFSVVITDLSSKVKTLAQEIALLEARLRKSEHSRSDKRTE